MSRSRVEVQLAIWSALTFGALLTSFMASRPVRDALVLDGDPNRIPWLFTASFLVFIAVAPAWGAAVRKSPRRVVPASFHLFAACSLGFFVLVRGDMWPHVTPYVFYIWAAVYNQFVVSVFWSLLADLVGPSTARRLYGPISAGGTIGAVGGPLLTKLLLDYIGVSGVLVMSALFLEVAVLGTWQIRRIARGLVIADAGELADKPLPQNPWNGLVQTARSPFLSAMAAFVLCTAIAATFVYIAQANIVKVALPDRHTRTDYFATVDLWQQAATFVIQLVVAPLLLRRVGPGAVLCVLPLLQLAGIVGLYFAPSLAMIVAVQVSSRTVAFGLTRPARELLFTVVSRDDKYRAKNVIDTLIYRLGDFISAWSYVGLGLGLVAISIPLTAVWVALAIALGIGFRRRVSLKESAA